MKYTLLTIVISHSVCDNDIKVHVTPNKQTCNIKTSQMLDNMHCSSLRPSIKQQDNLDRWGNSTVTLLQLCFIK